MRLRTIGLIAGGVGGVLLAVPAVIVAAMIVVSVFTKFTVEGDEARARIEAAFALVLPDDATEVLLIENPLPEWTGTAAFAAPADAVTAWLDGALPCAAATLSDGLAALPDPAPVWREIAAAGPVASGHCPGGSVHGGDMAILVEKGDRPVWRVHLTASAI